MAIPKLQFQYPQLKLSEHHKIPNNVQNNSNRQKNTRLIDKNLYITYLVSDYNFKTYIVEAIDKNFQDKWTNQTCDCKNLEVTPVRKWGREAVSPLSKE